MSIRVFQGPMWSGKTSALISAIRDAQIKVGDEHVIAVKHSRDDRYDATEIVSHNGVRCKAIAVPELKLLEHIIEYYPHITHIFVDEAQFFPDTPEFCRRMRKMDRHITIAGLDLDFRREPFLPMLQTASVSNSSETLHAECADCGSSAPFTHLFKANSTPKDTNIIIGGADKYMPLCEACYDKHSV